MFNSPLLDVAIGLVFIFLLYSLLATSVNEAIATLFGLRARMLKKGIIEGMLSNSRNEKWWTSAAIWIKENFLEIFNTITSNLEKPEQEKKIGDKFYDHPIIKNYGSSRIFPTPSYIPKENFSVVLIDVLKKEFDKRLDDIAQYKLSLPANRDTLPNIQQSLQYSADTVKIKEVLDYYSRHYAVNNTAPPLSVIDKETLQIMQMHLRNSIYSIENFSERLEKWFDDSMNRVSGWYKRQAQIILFFIGIGLAVVFNVDTIEISGKLSTDKDARDKLVQLATQAVDKYKDDPRVKKIATGKGDIVPDTSQAGRETNDSIFKQYQAKADSIKKFVEDDLKKANDIVALGWGDYGMKRDSAKVMQAYFDNTGCFSSKVKPVKSTPKRHQEILDSIYETHWITHKAGYVLKQSTRGKKFLGFLLTAFAVCLGAPFWFDLLNKLVKLRAAGKKEDGDTAGNKEVKAGNTQQPITLNVNTQTGEEAVG